MFRTRLVMAAIVFAAATSMLGQVKPGGAVNPLVAVSQRAANEPAGQVKLPDGASQDWWGKVQGSIRQDEYNVVWQDASPAKKDGSAKSMPAGWAAANRTQGFTLRFNETGFVATPWKEGACWEWGLSLVAWGRSGALQPAGKGALHAETNWLTVDRPGITESFLNDDHGLEQGFTLLAPTAELGVRSDKSGVAPPDASHLTPHELYLDLALMGNLHPRLAENGQAVDFYDNGNVSVIHYAQLKVTDAAGRVLPAHFEGFASSQCSIQHSPFNIASGGIRIAIDDSNAVYPITVDPLATSPAWTRTGGGGDYLGIHMAAVGDVNGDDYSDALVQGGAVVELYLGGPSGLATLPAWITSSTSWGVAGAGDINGDGYSDFLVLGDPIRVFLGGPNGPTEAAGPACPESSCVSTFGMAAAAAGDVNGDGYGDVVVGAYQFGAPGPAYDSGLGRAYLYLGAAAGLSLTPAWSVSGDAQRDLLGYAVSTAGDVNGDGYADVLVGGKGYLTRPGQVRLYLGSASGLASTAAWTVTTAVIGDGLGTVVSTAGDVNGDGYADFMTATPADNSNTGRVDLYLGGASGPSTTPTRTYFGEAAGDLFGTDVETAGDVDGDGYADVAVGAQGNASSTGKVYLYRGGPLGLGATAVWTSAGEKATDSYGAVLAGGGDVNGDGFSDLMISSPPFVADLLYPNIHNGRAYLYLGGPSGPAAAPGWTGSGEATSNYYGWSLASAGDVNGDGYSDAVVGAYFINSGTGKAYLYLGGPSGLSVSPAWIAAGEAVGIYFGMSVAGAGDVNGDGYADVVVGAKNYSAGTNYYQGKAYLYLGGASGLSTTALWTAAGETGYSYFGGSVAGAGDVNGDGYADVVVGAYGYGSSTGRAYLYLGGQGGLSSSAAWTATGEAVNDNYAYSVATAGDVNGDGYSDMVAGAYGYSSQDGKAYVYLGGPTGLSATSAWSQSGPALGGARYGCAVATAGDVNGDGYSDLLVGASFYNSRLGSAYLYFGGAAGLSTSASWFAAGEVASSLFGNAVASAGDINGDGYSDVVVGAQGYSTSAGKAYLYLGSAAGLSSAAAWSGAGTASDRFGFAVGAGDFNGDGYSDLLVGAPYSTTSSGRVYSYGGNGGACLSLVPRQLRADGTTPVAPLGLAYDQQARLGVKLRSPFGRGLTKVEWQAVPLHGSLSPAINPVESLSRWYDSGLSGTARAELVNLSDATGPWTWRVRVRYSPATTALMPHSRWLTLDANGLRETDLRSVTTAPPPACVVPDEPCWLYLVTKVDINYTLNWQDPNQSNQRTGWNIRRSNNPALAKSAWPFVGTNVVDEDEATPNYQWTDISGADPGPGGVWYYEVTTYNANCPAEGPF